MGDASTNVVQVVNPAGTAPVVLVCEHASPFMPPEYAALGMSEQDQLSHAAWDPGAMVVAQGLSEALDARLVASRVSRLIYDCNRPPNAPDAMPVRSEVIDIPGNVNLSDAARAGRVAQVYVPFREQLCATLGQISAPILITIHSFTPIYFGKKRTVEIGVLHDTDTRLADAMLASASAHMTFDVQRNAPYGAGDGVTHTLREHGTKHGHLNVMLEIRSDLIETPDQQQSMATTLGVWIKSASADLRVPWGIACQA